MNFNRQILFWIGFLIVMAFLLSSCGTQKSDEKPLLIKYTVSSGEHFLVGPLYPTVTLENRKGQEAIVECNGAKPDLPQLKGKGLVTVNYDPNEGTAWCKVKLICESQVCDELRATVTHIRAK